MNGIRIAHMADLHINTPFSGLDAEKAKLRRHELLESLDAAVAAALEEKADIIAIAGDLFDNAEDMRVVRYVMERLDGCGLPVFIAAGNHDPLNEVYSGLKPYNNIHIFGDSMEYIDLDGVRIHGASFKEKNCAEALLRGIDLSDGINVLVMHGDVGTGTYNPMDRRMLAEFDYCALGHIHDYSGIVRTENGAWAYPGFCEPRGFDETGRGGIIIAEVMKGNVKAERRLVSKREYIKIETDISDCADNLDIADIIQEMLLPENIYSIELCGACGEFTVTPDYIKKCLEVFCFDIDVRVRGGRDYEALADGYTLRGVFVSKMLALAARASDADKKKYMHALDIGLDAFEKAGERR